MINNAKPKRSVPLSQEELDYMLKALALNGGSKTKAGLALGISKDVFDRTITYGSCSEATYNTVFGEKKMIA